MYTNVGISMMPLLKQGRDLMIVERVPEKLHWLDSVVFKRRESVYVLHRIMYIRRNPKPGEAKYIICGDNSLQLEPVHEEQIIGILTGVVRHAGSSHSRTLHTSAYWYKVYSLLAWCSWPFRRVAAGCWHIIKRTFGIQRGFWGYSRD